MSARLIGETLRAARHARGLTQEQLAKRIGVGRTQVTNIEGDRFCPSLHTIQEAAQAMHVSFSYSPKHGWRWRRDTGTAG